jgi:hypothetical protein
MLSALALAADALDSGKAKRILSELVRITNSSKS